MTIRRRTLHPWIVAGTLALLGAPSWVFAQKGLKISVADDPSMKEGSPAVVLVEVGDFQCPYCGQGAREVLPQVYETFIRTGKVELIFLDLPLAMHPNAFKAAEAAACAGDQKMFWEMHSTLFGNQRALAPEQLSGYAEELGLDVPAFQACLSGGKHAREIREDMRIAQTLGITGTPAYLVAERLSGGDKVKILEVVRGLPSYEELEKMIKSVLPPEPAPSASPPSVP